MAAYKSRHTAYNGIILWLQGHVSTDHEGVNYLKGMDWNQMSAFTKKHMISFLSKKGIHFNRNHPYNENYAAGEVQKNWKEFMEYIKSNL